MKKRITAIFGGLLWIALSFGLTACAVGGEDDSSSPISGGTSIEDSSSSDSDSSVDSSSSDSDSSGDSSSSDSDSSVDSSSPDEQEEYTITYDLGVVKGNPDAVITSTKQAVYYNETLTLYTPTCGQYKFLYWTVEGQNEPFTATEYPFEDSITLVANWRDFYYITYDLGVCNGNSNANIDRTQETVRYGETFSMPKPSCGLYQFLYWSLNGSTSFTNTTYPFTDDITLTAIWKTPYYISLDLGECAGNPNAFMPNNGLLIYHGELVHIDEPTCDGYKFAGWTLQSTGEVFNAKTYLFEENITLVANWKKAYIITYDLGGLQDLPSQTVYYGEQFYLAFPSVDNRQFMHWEVQGTGEILEDGKYPYEYDVTVVAVWAPYTITYKVYDVEGTTLVSTTTQNVNYGEKVTLEQPTPPKGYEFVGWEIEGTNTRIADAVYEYNHEEDIVLVAVWQEREFSEFE